MKERSRNAEKIFLHQKVLQKDIQTSYVIMYLIQTFATKNKIVISGEVTSKGKIDIEKIARNAIKESDMEMKTLILILTFVKLI